MVGWRRRPGESREARARREAAGPQSTAHEHDRRLRLGCERLANLAESAPRPAIRESGDSQRRICACVEHAADAWRDEQRLGGDAECELDCERGTRELPACVAPARLTGGSDEAQLTILRRGDPSAKLDRRPIVLPATKRHQNNTSGILDRATHEEADVARGSVNTSRTTGSASRAAGASRSRRSTSCSRAMRTMSAAGALLVKAAALALTPVVISRSRCSSRSAFARPSSPPSATARAITRARRGRRASGSARESRLSTAPSRGGGDQDRRAGARSRGSSSRLLPQDRRFERAELPIRVRCRSRRPVRGVLLDTRRVHLPGARRGTARA